MEQITDKATSSQLHSLVDGDFRALLESAVRKLGPERSASALLAWGADGEPDIASGWDGCVFARAYGERCELMNAAFASRAGNCWSFALDAFGLTPCEQDAVISAFDDSGTPKHRLLKDLLAIESSKIDQRAAQAPQHITGRA